MGGNKINTGMAFLFTTRQMIKYQQVSAEIWLRNMIPEYIANTMSWWGSREKNRILLLPFFFLEQFKREIAGEWQSSIHRFSSRMVFRSLWSAAKLSCPED